MKQIADGLEQVPGFPPNAINVYVMGGVVVDAATRHARRRILKAVAGREITAHAVTHAHADHQGASHAVCEALGVPFYGPAAEADALESGDLRTTMPDNAICRWQMGLRPTRPAPATRSPGGCARATRSAASRSWRRPATHPVTSPTGASRIARSSSATSSSGSTR